MLAVALPRPRHKLCPHQPAGDPGLTIEYSEKDKGVDFFEHSLGPPDAERHGASIWMRDEPYTSEEEWLSQPFDAREYEREPTKHLYFKWIDDQFVCGNPECGSSDVECIWYHYDGIDLGVDQTFGEFRCRECGQYMFVEYQRDSS